MVLISASNIFTNLLQVNFFSFKNKEMSEQVVKSDPNVKKWYVVRAISGQEKKVKQYLETEIVRLNLTDYVSQVLIPTEKIYQIRNGKKVAKERSFYPGYIMIEAILTGEIPHIIKNITGVIGFLGETKGGEAIPMRLSEVNRILGKVDELAEADGVTFNPFIVGENVKVINGPFNGFSGVIEEINEEKKKMKVSVKIFGRKTPLELNYGEVEKE
jgi:transcription termination/antitermination protein NusG